MHAHRTPARDVSGAAMTDVRAHSKTQGRTIRGGETQQDGPNRAVHSHLRVIAHETRLFFGPPSLPSPTPSLCRSPVFSQFTPPPSISHQQPAFPFPVLFPCWQQSVSRFAFSPVLPLSRASLSQNSQDHRGTDSHTAWQIRSSRAPSWASKHQDRREWMRWLLGSSSI